MAFTTVDFALFLLISLFLYYIVPQKFRWIILLIASYRFYLAGGLGVLGYILFTTATTYLGGCLIGSVRATDDTKEARARAKSKKKLWAGICLVLNFALLYLVKYWNFTLDTLGVNEGVLRLDLLMPLGLSFYIFQSMGYIIDLTREKYEPQRNPFKLALFVSFFPQLTQGPIGRYNELAPQLYKGGVLSADSIKEGAKLILLGYIKKLVIADRAAVVANAVIDSYKDFNGTMILFGVIFYCIQLYCDFSGGIDIARGTAHLFGINMAQNFKRPIFATSLADFWRRWHITLGSWLRDYLFYPLTLSKPFIAFGKLIRKHIKGKAGKILPTSVVTFIVYFVIGIWHGANWKYILFGIWNGVIITASLLMEPFFTSLKKKLSVNDGAWWYKALCIIRTTAIVVMGRYITRAENVTSAIEMLKRTFTDFSIQGISVMTLGLTGQDYAVILLGIAVLFILELGDEIGISITEKIESKGVVPTFITVFAVVLVLVLFGFYRGDYIASEFIYKQF